MKGKSNLLEARDAVVVLGDIDDHGLVIQHRDISGFQVALQPEEGQESCRREWHVRGPAVQRKDLGQYVEQRNGHYGAGTEPEQEMKAIAKP